MIHWIRGIQGHGGNMLLAALAVPTVLVLLAACSDATPTPDPVSIVQKPTPTPEVIAPTAVPTEPRPPSPQNFRPTGTPSTSTVPAPAIDPTVASTPIPVASNLRAAADDVYALLEELVAELGHRVSGTEEERRAAELLKERYESMGYEVEIQPFQRNNFDFGYWFMSGGDNAAVVVESGDLRFEGLPLTTSPDTRQNSGPLLTLDLSKGETPPADEIAGKVIHIVPGHLDPLDWQAIERMHDRIYTLADAGAVAVVISQSLGEHIQFPIVSGVDLPVPALFLHQTNHARQLIDLAAKGNELVVSVKIEAERLESQNVIAELRGTGNEVVVVGAHYDIVPETKTGANDNASGTAVLLSLAKALSGKTLPFTVRFVSFGAEEVGLYGSSHYVDSLNGEELGRIKAMLNFDVVGSGEYTAVSGGQEITELALGLAGQRHVQARAGSLPYGASSDHTPFEMADVPVGLFWAPEISRIHSSRDRLEFIDPQRLVETFLLAEALLTSPKFPPR